MKRHSTQRIQRWQISTWKDVQHPESLGKYKLNPQLAITTHLSGWLRLKQWQHHMLMRTRRLNHSHIVGGNVKWYSHSGKQAVSFFKNTTHATFIRTSNYNLGHLSQRNKNFGSQKSLFTNVHNGFFHNSPKPETRVLQLMIG